MSDLSKISTSDLWGELLRRDEAFVEEREAIVTENGWVIRVDRGKGTHTAARYVQRYWRNPIPKELTMDPTQGNL